MAEPFAHRLDQLRRGLGDGVGDAGAEVGVGVERGRQGRGAEADPLGRREPGDRAQRRRAPRRPAVRPSTSAATCTSRCRTGSASAAASVPGRRASVGSVRGARWAGHISEGTSRHSDSGRAATISSDPRPTVATMAAPVSSTAFVQTSFDELDEPLRTTTFTVVDLETTGGSSMADGITEIGAVKVRGGEVLGEFQTLVAPGAGDHAVRQRADRHHRPDGCVARRRSTPRCRRSSSSRAAACWSRTTRRSTSGSSRRPAVDQHLAWPAFAVVDTAVLARRVLTRDEVPNCKLATLAQFFQAATTPNHRALSDARATVDVLHGLIARLGNIGVQSLPELRAFTAQVSPEVRRKRHLADAMPTGPGVYVFRDGRGVPLYVGTSRNLRTRVRQYFVASETRTRMGEMVGLAERVDPISCAHALEAQVRELRLIAAHKPRYNRRSKYPERSVWLKLTARGRSRGCRSCGCCARTGRATSGRCARSGRPRRCATRSTTRCRCGSAATGSRCAARCAPPARWPASAGAPRRARAAPRRPTTPRWSSWSPRRGPATCGR